MNGRHCFLEQKCQTHHAERRATSQVQLTVIAYQPIYLANLHRKHKSSDDDHGAIQTLNH